MTFFVTHMNESLHLGVISNGIPVFVRLQQMGAAAYTGCTQFDQTRARLPCSCGIASNVQVQDDRMTKFAVVHFFAAKFGPQVHE